MTERLLVVRGGALGDFVLGIPALHALRSAFPRANLELMGPGALLPLAAMLVDIATPLERAEVAALFGDADPLPEEIALRYGGLDLVVLWLSDAEGAVRRNFRRLGAQRVLWAPAFPSRPGLHVADHLMDTLRPLGISLDAEATGRTSLRPRPSARQRAAEAMARLGLDSDGPKAGDPSTGEWRLQPERGQERPAEASTPPSEGNADQGTLLRRPLVAIHPGSGGGWKCWPAERFAQVADRLAASGLQVVLIQGPADEAAVRQLVSSARESEPAVVADLDVEALAAFLETCSCHVGNDSGVSHLAAALEVPTVAIFGPTDPAVWAPRGPRVIVLRGEEMCSPCSPEAALRCQTRACLESVSVEQVMGAVASSCRSKQPRDDVAG